MSRNRPTAVLCLFASFFISIQIALGAEPDPGPASMVSLNSNWQIQSSCDEKATGEQISSANFAAKGWHKTTVPNTVVGTLVDDKTYPDPTYGTNLMHFPGINYRANVWVNGKKIADAKDVAGTYRIFEFDVTNSLKPGAANAIALEIFAPQKNDLGITWVDWNPTPADKDMGIWKEVSLTMSGPVAVRHPFATSKLDSTYKSAELVLAAELRNDSTKSVKGAMVVDVDGKQLKQEVELAVGETKTTRFDAANYPQLRLANPKLWWPHTIGTPNLYTAKFSFVTNGAVSDAASVKFGIREVT